MKNKKALIIILIIALGALILYLSSNYTSQSKNSFKSPSTQDNKENKQVKILDKDTKDDIKKEEKQESESNKDNKIKEENKGENAKKYKESKNDITFLMMGVDDGERSDTMIVFKHFGNTGKISALSIPRDTRTEIPGYGLDKINHAHAFKGPDLSLKAVNDLLGMDIEQYVRVDYELVKEIVDTVGGIDIDVPKNTEFWNKGTNHFDGNEALEFVRYRSGYSNQDLGRISSQQEFLKQLLIKMKDTQNILKVTKMMKLGIDNINTNIPITKMLSYALILKDTDTSNLEMMTLPGNPTMINKISYIIVDREEIPKIVDELFYNDQIK